MSEQEKYPPLSRARPRRAQSTRKQHPPRQKTPDGGIRADSIQATSVVVGTQITYGAAESRKQHIPLQRPRRAEHFVDREAERERLLAELQAGRVVTVCGLGGMGKTTLVAEVLWTLAPGEHPPAAFPDGLLFYSFYGQPQVTIALEQLARTLGEEPLPTPALAVQRALSGRHILLVLDGAEEADQLEQVLTACGGSAVLMTSRRRADAPDPAHRLDLHPLPTEEAVTVVQSFGGARAGDSEATSQICAQVGNLPLALRLVGRYLAQQEEEASEYLAWLQETPLVALDQGRSQRESVQVLLQRSIARLSATARRAFQLVGLLALAPFESELVGQILELAEREVRQALGELVNYGILLRQQNHYEVSHPLLHTYARQELLVQDNAATRQNMLERVVQVLNEQFPQVEFTTWSQCEVLVPHIQACALQLEPQQEGLVEAASLFMQAGRYLVERGRYEQAEDLFTRAVAIRERVLEPEHAELALSLDRLATIYQYRGKYDQAVPLFQRALVIYEKTLGPEHPSIAATLDNLGGLYRHLGKYEQATPLFQRALTIREKTLGTEHPVTAITLNNLALLYSNQGKYEQAEPLYQRALAIYEKTLGSEHPYIAAALQNLADLYQRRGKYGQAESLYQRALAINEKTRGLEHPFTATTIFSLAYLYQRQKRNEQAELLYQRALAIYEHTLPPEHPDIVNILRHYASLLRVMNRPHEAHALEQRASTMRARRTPSNTT